MPYPVKYTIHKGYKMEDWKERNRKMNTSFEAFNYIWAYILMSMLFGWALFADWLMGRSLYSDFSFIPDGYYWWVVGGFVFSSFAAVVGRYCMNASVDAG